MFIIHVADKRRTEDRKRILEHWKIEPVVVVTGSRILGDLPSGIDSDLFDG